MENRKLKKNFFITIIKIWLLTFLFLLFPFRSVSAQNIESTAQAATFEELKSWLNQNQSTGGVITLIQDITIPKGETYTYLNARYSKEVVIETQGHTIYVEGYLDLWPYLTIRGDGSEKELFHVNPGGELRLVSVCIDAGEEGTAIIQEEGSFLMCGSEESMGLPAFSCTGSIVSPEKMTAAAYWKYNFDQLPIVRVPDGMSFTSDLLPETVLARVNRCNEEYEEEIPVIWDEMTFPSDEKRTLIEGYFTDEYAQYADYAPKCLVLWESETDPFFLNVYLSAPTQLYDMVFMYAETPQAGKVLIQSSNDGENWAEITGTEGYEPINAEENGGLSWILEYPQIEAGVEIPRYYRMVQIQADGTELYSEALELSDDHIFVTGDIEGGRGGETSPDEGEDQLPNNIWGSESDGDTDDETEEPEKEDTEEESDIIEESDAEDTEILPEDPPIYNGTNSEIEYSAPVDEAVQVPNPEHPYIESDTLSEQEESDSTETVWAKPPLTGEDSKTSSSAPSNVSSEASMSDYNISSSQAQTDSPVEQPTGNEQSQQAEPVGYDNSEKENTSAWLNREIVIGTGIVVCIVASSVILSVTRKKK